MTFADQWRLLLDTLTERHGSVYGGASQNASRTTRLSELQRGGRAGRISPGVRVQLRLSRDDHPSQDRYEHMDILSHLQLVGDKQTALANRLYSPKDCNMALFYGLAVGLYQIPDGYEAPEPLTHGAGNVVDLLRIRDDSCPPSVGRVIQYARDMEAFERRDGIGRVLNAVVEGNENVGIISDIARAAGRTFAKAGRSQYQKLSPSDKKRLCATCGASDHTGKGCINSEFTLGWAAKQDLSFPLVTKEDSDMAGLTYSLVQSFGFSECPRRIALQLYDVFQHRDKEGCAEKFETAWDTWAKAERWMKEHPSEWVDVE